MTGRTLVWRGIIWKDCRNTAVLQQHDAQLLLGCRLYPHIFSSVNTVILSYFLYAGIKLHIYVVLTQCFVQCGCGTVRMSFLRLRRRLCWHLWL